MNNNNNIAIEPPTKVLAFGASELTVKIGPHVNAFNTKFSVTSIQMSRGQQEITRRGDGIDCVNPNQSVLCAPNSALSNQD